MAKVGRPLSRDLTGERFGRLLVTERCGSDVRGSPIWRAMCDCGTEKCVSGGALRSGDTQSCGCFHVERRRSACVIHGCARVRKWTPEYRAWQSMKGRCGNPKAKKYMNYGGRGITVCEQWLGSFEAFLADMGLKPSPKHSIDRRDNDGNYEPGNCRWATSREQANNRRVRRDSRKLRAAAESNLAA